MILMLIDILNILTQAPLLRYLVVQVVSSKSSCAIQVQDIEHDYEATSDI